MADRLRDYRSKRDFAATPEPAGERRRRAAKAPRFVIHEHHARRLHWDLRLERDGVLASWAIPNGLPNEPKRNHFAARTEDHPLEYLKFEGEIPRGEYGAGTIAIWDRGTYELLKWEPRKVEVALHGSRVDARYALFALEQDGDWMIHRMDPPDDPEAEPMPERMLPMLASSGKLPAREEDYGFEIKWDGVRVIAHSEPGRLKLHTRNLNDVTQRYPELAPLNRALSHHRAVLDGEIIAFGPSGRPSFSALQRRMHLADERQARRLASEAPVTYVLFDLLWLDGHPLLDRPYAERRAELRALVADGPRWRVPEHFVGHGAELLALAREQGLEGVMAKRLDSPYEPGRRSSAWIKLKLRQREQFVVAGWLPGAGNRRERIGALLLGTREGGGLRYVGRVGSGFSERELDRLARLLGPRECESSPFSADGPQPPRGAIFTERGPTVDVAFAEWTPDGLLRAPSYHGEVPEKRSATIAKDDREVRLANPDKVLYPASGFVKRDLVDYYLAIAPTLLPHLADRALTLKRYPDGVEGKSFFEKRAPSHRPEWVDTVTVRESGGSEQYVTVRDAATLAWLGNLAVLELHTPLHRAQDPGTPTILAFDLDPGEPATIIECCQVALWLQGTLGGIGLETFAKTSGSKGMQVYVPLNNPDADYEQTKTFAKTVAELLARDTPELVVATQRKSLRGGKVLIDWSQNDRHKTTVCVYSPRARERPTVSTPLSWDEVEAALRDGDPEALAFDTAAVLERVERHGDLFAPVVSLRQKLP